MLLPERQTLAGKYVLSVRSRLDGMGKYSCPWRSQPRSHGQEYLPMPPKSDYTLNTYQASCQ
ncbi:MAG: hypothetical protein IID41_07765 [Planctomycetes bacterium]|nr:hypothetical protein [Planctomycetota bacterium]MCH8965471.1 hypothetical protein [Planctomycetota bacterium]